MNDETKNILLTLTNKFQDEATRLFSKASDDLDRKSAVVSNQEAIAGKVIHGLAKALLETIKS